MAEMTLTAMHGAIVCWVVAGACLVVALGTDDEPLQSVAAVGFIFVQGMSIVLSSVHRRRGRNG